MKTVPRWDLKIWRGADFSELITALQTKGGSPVDFTGKVITSSIREHPDFSSTEIASFTIPAISDGKIYLTLTRAITSAITHSKGYYDIIVTTTTTNFAELYIYGEVIFEDVKTYTAS